MNHQRVRILGLSMTFLLATALLGASVQAAPSRSHDLGDEMHAMGRDFKTLHGQINDSAKNSSSLEAIADMEQHTLAAKLLTPPMIKDVPEARRPAFMSAFRIKIAQLLQQELDLEQQLLDNHNDQAAETLKKMKLTQTEGHKEFREKK